MENVIVITKVDKRLEQAFSQKCEQINETTYCVSFNDFAAIQTAIENNRKCEVQIVLQKSANVFAPADIWEHGPVKPDVNSKLYQELLRIIFNKN